MLARTSRFILRRGFALLSTHRRLSHIHPLTQHLLDHARYPQSRPIPPTLAMPLTPSFISFLPLSRPTSLSRTPRYSAASRRPVRTSPRRVRGPPRTTPTSAATVRVGEVVAAQLGASRVAIALVAGVAASGDTVDITELDEFVREMYVQGKGGTTYVAAEQVRPVRAEYVPSQEGWIVLQRDLEAAKNYFKTLESGAVGGSRVQVQATEPKELKPEALERQFLPKPTRAQAFVGSALSLPTAALCYSGFAAARQAYASSPAGAELLTGEVSRQIVLFTAGAACVGSLVVGGSLFLYALSATDD